MLEAYGVSNETALSAVLNIARIYAMKGFNKKEMVVSTAIFLANTLINKRLNMQMNIPSLTTEETYNTLSFLVKSKIYNHYNEKEMAIEVLSILAIMKLSRMILINYNLDNNKNGSLYH